MKVNTVIIGGGISGLSTANFLSKKTSDFLILEASDIVGGTINSSKLDGYILENGPNTVLDNNKAIQELLSDLSITEELIYPNLKKISNRYILINDRLEKIPLTIFEFISTPILSIYSKIKIFSEILVPRHINDTNVESFIKRRFGKEFHDNLIVPFLTGIYADTTSKMSTKNTLKKMWELEQKHGSIIVGLIKEKNKHITEISRKDEIFISKNGLITIAGGKLTGYRKMSERVVDLLCNKLFNLNKKCITKNIKLFDTSFDEYLTKGKNLNASHKDLIKIYNIYGSKGIQIFEIQNDYNSKIKNERLLISELIYCLKNEMCHNLLDFFTQRNAMVYFEIERINSSVDFIKKPYMKFKNISNDEWKKELCDLKNYIDKITTFI